MVGLVRARTPRLSASFDVFRAALLVTTAFAFTPARAEDADHPEVEEIVVTALKRETLVNQTPLAITALPGKFLEDIGATEFNDYFRRVPGLAAVDNGTGRKRYLIRGVSTIETGVSQATVAQYLDEVPITDNFDQQPDPHLIDVDRIEVLRGPQGTLFGARSMAGTIRTITRKPELGRFDARGTAMLSDTRFGGMNENLEGVLNIPAGETVAFRGAGFYTFNDGVIDNEFPGGRFVPNPQQLPPGIPVPAPTTVAPINMQNFSSTREYGGRLAARWQPNDRFTFDLMGLAQNTTLSGLPFYNVDQTGDESRGLKTSLAGSNGNGDHLRIASTTLAYDAGFADVTAVGSYADRNNAADTGAALQGPLAAAPLGGSQSFGADTRGWTGEVRAASKGDGALQWLIGGYAFSQARTNRVFMQLGFGQVTVSDITAAGHTREHAGFGEISYKPFPSLTATAGVRYSDYENNVSRYYRVPPPGSGTPAGPDRHPLQYSDDNTTLKFQVSYEPNSDLLTYVLASQGFRPGGFNPNAQPGYTVVPASFASDSLWNYEIGAKTNWLDHRLQVNGALYRIDWTNMQVQGFAPAPFGPGTITYASNTGGSRIVGLELEADAVVNDHFSLDLSFNHFFEDELTKDAPVNPNGLAAKAGDPLSFDPQTSFNVGAEYHTPLFLGLDGAARMDWSYVGRRHTGFRPTLMNGQANTLFNNLSPYNLVDLRLSAGKDNWRATLYVQNIADERAVLQQQNPMPPATEISRVAARPRTVGLMLNARY